MNMIATDVRDQPVLFKSVRGRDPGYIFLEEDQDTACREKAAPTSRATLLIRWKWSGRHKPVIRASGGFARPNEADWRSGEDVSFEELSRRKDGLGGRRRREG